MVERTSTVNGPLREVAGRLSKLSYRDMRHLALCIATNGDFPEITNETFVDRIIPALLGAVDDLEGA